MHGETQGRIQPATREGAREGTQFVKKKYLAAPWTGGGVGGGGAVSTFFLPISWENI